MLRREEWRPSYSLVSFVLKCSMLSFVNVFRRGHGIDLRVSEEAASSGLWVALAASFGVGTEVGGILHFLPLKYLKSFSVAICVFVPGSTLR